MTEMLSDSGFSPVQLLQFYADIGIDIAVEDVPQDKTQHAPSNVVPVTAERAAPAALAGLAATPAAPVAAAVTAGAIEAMEDARMLAREAKTLDELRAALDKFQGLSIKRTAKNTVFADGNPQARVMVVGEAPGADEDRMGLPFVGVSGQLLDRMFACIGLSRENNLYISNVINWRPPGNRSPDDTEIALSLPFIRRHIEIVNPAVVIFTGGVAAKALMQTSQGITRLRGRWTDYHSEGLAQPVPAMAMFHPAYLLRSPQQKGLAWQDLLQLKSKLAALSLL